MRRDVSEFQDWRESLNLGMPGANAASTLRFMRIGAGGADLRVFLHSGLKCWSLLPGSGQREVGRLPISLW
jgi:hypothetical protein